MNNKTLQQAILYMQNTNQSEDELEKKVQENMSNTLPYPATEKISPAKKYLNENLNFIETLSMLSCTLTDMSSRLSILEAMADTSLCIDLFLIEHQNDMFTTIKDIRRLASYPSINTPIYNITACFREIAQMQKILAQYLRDDITMDHDIYDTIRQQFVTLTYMFNVLKTHYDVTDKEFSIVRYIKSEMYMVHIYSNADFVPDVITTRTNDNTKINIDFNDETALGEPCAWLYFSDKTSLEICHEEDNLLIPFYSVRLHCSEEDFENDTYHKTCGVIESHSCNTFLEAVNLIKEMVETNNTKGITLVEE